MQPRQLEWLRKLFKITWKREGCAPNQTSSPALFTFHIKIGLQMHLVRVNKCYYNQITTLLQRQPCNWHEIKPNVVKKVFSHCNNPKKMFYEKQILVFS